MKKTKPKKLLTVLLALCMVLSIVPITAFAVEIDFLPQGVTYLNDFKHTYHTQVNVTANVSVKDSNGAVVETTQVSKSSGEFNFITEGFPSAEVLQTAVGNLQTEIETPYKARGTVTSENESAGPIIDHFESASLYTFTPTSGNPVDFSSDLEAAKQYFNEHPDATGTFTVIRDVHQYQIYDYTYDLTVQENSQPASTITSAVVKNVKFNYQPGDAPQATAEVYNADADKYEIAYECWQKFDNNEPVAAWYSDNGAHGSLPTITEFESGEKYVYFLMLKAKNGRTFAATDSGLTVTVNGWTVEQQNISVNLDGQSVYVTGIATITPTKPVEPKKIEVIEINNVTLTFKDGDKPVFTGTVPENDQYAFRCEWWSLDENTGIVSTEPEWGGDIYKNKITAFEAGKTYHYGVYVTAYTADISLDAKLKINGREVKYKRIGDESDTQSFWVETDLTMTPAADGHTHNYGTEWKYDETNHWHECECGNKADITAHTFKQIIDKEATATEKGSKHEECTVCGYKKAAVDIPKIDSHNHNYGTEWKYDGTNHWHECECGNKTDITAHTFKWIVDKEATTAEKGSKHEECTVCGYKKTAVDIPAIGFGSSSDDEANKPTNTVSSESSSADQTNKPINTASPKTGNTDNMILWIVLLIAGGGAFITATAVDRKKK